MEERYFGEKPASKRRREKMRVAGSHLIVGIPPVRVLDRVSLDIPVAVVRVPVRVHGPDLIIMRYAINTTAL